MTTADVTSFYDAFPYPTVGNLSHPLPPSFKRGALDVLLGRRKGDRLPADARIWVAGCGTQQALHWAQCFPEGEVLGTDVSETSLGIAAELARQLQISNVRLDRRDLMEPGDDERFDLIVATGVIHHLPDPSAGMRRLRAALKTNGAAVLMVYSRMHREPLGVFRRALQAFLKPEDDATARYAVASQLLDALLDGERCSPPAPGALELLRERRTSDHAFVADALLHPLEHTYDLDQFFALLEDAGFRHTSWLHPIRWRLSSYLDAGPLLERATGLAPREEWGSVYHAAGHAGPLLEAVIEPSAAPQRPAYTGAELLSLPLASCRRRAVIKIEAGRPTARGETPTYVVEGDTLHGVGHGPFGGAYGFSLPAYAEPLLEALDGRRPAADALRPFTEDFGAGPIEDMVTALSPLDVGLLAPIW